MTDTTGAASVAWQKKSKTLLGTGFGNALEWFDWGIYATFAPFFAGQFFDGSDPISSFLSTLVVFAVGFAARPLGGFVFGWAADRVGRKVSMAAAVGSGAAGSIAIGIAPTYASIGIGASLILVVARIVQGLAHGGELPSAQTYIAEAAPAQRRGLWSSLIYVSGTLGTMAGALLGAVLSAVLPPKDMASYGWRIPFVVGGILGLYALFMRARMVETEVFEDQRRIGRRSRLLPEIVRHRKQAWQVVGMTAGLTVAYYAWVVATPAYAIAALHVEPTAALTASLVSHAVFVLVLPLWGRISDRIGRKPVLLIGAVGTAVLLFPLNALLRDSAWQLGVTMTAAQIFIAASTAIAPAVFGEMFPTSIRSVGVGVPYSLCVAVFGGTAPYLQTWVGATYGRATFTGYIALLMVLSIAVIATVPETKGRELHPRV